MDNNPINIVPEIASVSQQSRATNFESFNDWYDSNGEKARDQALEARSWR
jgi:hypothetical protein